MYPTDGWVPSCLHPGITNHSPDAASRFMSLYSYRVWTKQRWVPKTKGYLVLLKTLVFRGRTKFPYCCNSKHGERELPCSGGAQFSPQLAAGGCQSLHREAVHQNAVSGPPHPTWSRLRGGGVQRGMCEEEVCTQDVCTKMGSTSAHFCKETLPCWNPQGCWCILCQGRKPAHFLEGTYVH